MNGLLVYYNISISRPMEIFEWAFNFNVITILVLADQWKSLNEPPILILTEFSFWNTWNLNTFFFFFFNVVLHPQRLYQSITLTVHGLLQYWGQGAQEAHLDFLTAPEFSMHTSSPLRFGYIIVMTDWVLIL